MQERMANAGSIIVGLIVVASLDRGIFGELISLLKSIPRSTLEKLVRD
jgi:hypothetical protein